MFQYIIKRILIFIPTFFVISLIIFGLSKMAPGDPVDVLMVGNGGDGGNLSDIMANEEAYAQKAKELGLDKPVFYFTLSSAAFPKDLYKIRKQHKRELVSRLINQYGNPDAVMAYYEKLNEFELAKTEIPEDSSFYELKNFVNQSSRDLFLDYEEAGIDFKLDTLNQLFRNRTESKVAKVKTIVKELQELYNELKNNPQIAKLYQPSLHFYGLDNQYHTWMFGDYPWFSSVDSSDYHRLDELYKNIAQLNKERDSLQRIEVGLEREIQQIDAMLGANDSLNTLESYELDSLAQLKAELIEEKSPLANNIQPLNPKLKSLKKEKDEINERLKIYASRGFLRGDFGTSYKDSRPVSTKMGEALKWTLIMNFFAILLSYLISIPLGVQSALWKKHRDRFVPFLSLASLIGAAIMVVSFYLYFSGSLSTSLHYLLIILVNIGFFIYNLLAQEDSQKAKFSLASFTSFWWDFIRLKLLNIAGNSVIVLKMLYLWVWTFLFFGFVLAPLGMKILVISIPLAIWGISKLRKTAKEKTQNFKISIKGLYTKGSFMDNLSTTVLFILYSLPSFWIGTLLITFFTTDQYGELYDWFPTNGVQTQEIASDPDASFWTKATDIMYHMFLPIFCITYGSFAYLSRQMRGAMLSVVRQDYIRTANAKGLSEHKVTWKHAFRNSLFPIITLFSSVFPRALSGAIAIELIYNIPGMGVLVLGAINERDWPVVFTVAMLASILTMIGNLVADILYAVVDPRISFK
jgi:ABC-type dipeptide/oligopeptide/nickel transport system permease component